MEPPYDVVAASRALAEADPRMAETIARIGPPTLTLRPVETLPGLLRSIVFQQLSTKAAATIHGRVLEAFGDGETLDPEALAAAPDEALRACGLSRAKTAAARDLVARHRAGTLPTRAELLAMPDDEVVRRLTEVRGVGPWTAQMVLLFNLGRPDVWPTTDLGVQEGHRIIHGLDARPTPREMTAIGEPYAPWRSVAAWYGWRAVHAARGDE
jgi:DNA-3-methyladenine glycosylase II